MEDAQQCQEIATNAAFPELVETTFLYELSKVFQHLDLIRFVKSVETSQQQQLLWAHLPFEGYTSQKEVV